MLNVESAQTFKIICVLLLVMFCKKIALKLEVGFKVKYDPKMDS